MSKSLIMQVNKKNWTTNRNAQLIMVTTKLKRLTRLIVATTKLKRLTRLIVATTKLKRLTRLIVATTKLKRLTRLIVATAKPKRLTRLIMATAIPKRLTRLIMATAIPNRRARFIVATADLSAECPPFVCSQTRRALATFIQMVMVAPCMVWATLAVALQVVIRSKLKFHLHNHALLLAQSNPGHQPTLAGRRLHLPYC